MKMALTIAHRKTRPDPPRAPVSWWIGSTPDHFTDLCTTQMERMATGPAANKVTDLRPVSWWVGVR